ncbi:MAG: hypothetical protein ACRC4N_04220 [Gammaproteobacteria bacterium]
MDRLTFSRRILQRELGFNPSQLDFVFALPGRKTFEVVFTTLVLYEQCLERFQRKKKESACFQKIDLIPLAERELRIVTVVMFSERIKLEDISTWLSLHCSVTKAFQIKDEDGVKTGASKFHVRLRTNEQGELSHLPSMIQLGSIRGFVFYNGQPKECRKCGSLNHLAAQCDSVFCRNCKNHGHVSKFCTVPMKCNLCGATNHRFQDCPSAYANKTRQQPGETREEDINIPEAPDMEEDFFRDRQPLVPATSEEQGAGVTLRQPLPSNSGDEDFGGLGGNSDVEPEEIVPREYESHRELNVLDSLVDFPPLEQPSPEQNSQSLNRNILLDALVSFPTSLPLLSDSSPPGDTLVEIRSSSPDTNDPSGIQDQEDSPDSSSLSSNSTPFLDFSEMSAFSSATQMNKELIPKGTDMQSKKKKRKRLKSKLESP